MKMRIGNNEIDFYFFWRWQYMRRKKNTGIDLNSYAFQMQDNLRKFELQSGDSLTSERILENVAESNFVYSYPDFIEYSGITVLEKSLFADKFDDEIIECIGDEPPRNIDRYNYIENNCHLVLIDKNSPTDVVVADIVNLLQNNSQARELVFIKRRGLSIEDYRKPGRDKARAP
jgi:hypothetical protein